MSGIEREGLAHKRKSLFRIVKILTQHHGQLVVWKGIIWLKRDSAPEIVSGLLSVAERPKTSRALNEIHCIGSLIVGGRRVFLHGQGILSRSQILIHRSCQLQRIA